MRGDGGEMVRGGGEGRLLGVALQTDPNRTPRPIFSEAEVSIVPIFIDIDTFGRLAQNIDAYRIAQNIGLRAIYRMN